MLKPEGDDEQLLVPTSCKTCTDAIKEGGKTIQVCKNCLVAANKTSCSTSTSSISSRSSSPLSQQQTRYRKPASAPPFASPSRSSSPSRKEDSVLNKILDKLNKLDNIEKQPGAIAWRCVVPGESL
ncbi:hypothetical protein TSAR_004432 [Trichomalopsis sarcophagae]|uniref:Uncharacterized protein n=1 Tax=Trichomalopsis sarcophagae TaxID=543379 RepID=A0A232EGG8_9HYME|nr:hypothetical protein TSAR_004432 [Trichomalopsis sarcophagae]